MTFAEECLKKVKAEGAAAVATYAARFGELKEGESAMAGRLGGSSKRRRRGSDGDGSPRGSGSFRFVVCLAALRLPQPAVYNSAAAQVSKDEMKAAYESLDEGDRLCLDRVAARVKHFAETQRAAIRDAETDIPGGKAGHTVRPVALGAGDGVGAAPRPRRGDFVELASRGSRRSKSPAATPRAAATRSPRRSS